MVGETASKSGELDPGRRLHARPLGRVRAKAGVIAILAAFAVVSATAAAPDTPSNLAELFNFSKHTVTIN